jgi:hypothetical protein
MQLYHKAISRAERRRVHEWRAASFTPEVRAASSDPVRSRDMRRNSYVLLAVCAILGSALVTACSATSSGAAAAPSAVRSSAASSPSSLGRSPSPSPMSPGGQGGSSSPGGSPNPAQTYYDAVPGVIDCGKSLSTLEARPASLLLACADGTAGLQDLTWSHWGTAITARGSMGTATGAGEFFLNECNPNCARGHDQTYPVQVTLPVVYGSSEGDYFGQLSLQWLGSKPPAGTKSLYTLPAPS